MDDGQQVLGVLGATGFIGGRLIPRLLDKGYRVRAMARDPSKLRGRSWAAHPGAELTTADVLNPASLEPALAGVDTLYYLVHSMNPRTADFSHADREAARNTTTAAAAAGVKRIIYLSGLGETGPGLSRHLHSRAEVGRILAAGPVPVTVFRAAMIIGSGSASFEILRYLVERLPLMVTPRWVATPCQPIAIRNVLGYLIGCLDRPETIGSTFDIGQNQVVTYRELMEIYAEEAGLRPRWIIPVPVLTPRLSSYWIHLVTPVPATIARPLAEGLSNPVVCRDQRIRDLIPQDLLEARQAIRLALERLRQHQVESSWTDAGRIPPAEWSLPGDPRWAGGTVYQDGRRVVLPASPERVWEAVARIGGSTGWYYADWLWRWRGFLDRLVGGVGLRRGRRHPAKLQVGDALDFWRVAAVDPPRRLMLTAEMKLPGAAMLEFILQESPEGTEVRQIARFLPRGLGGIIYWWLVMPFHHLIFSGMLLGLSKAVGHSPLRKPEKYSG